MAFWTMFVLKAAKKISSICPELLPRYLNAKDDYDTLEKQNLQNAVPIGSPDKMTYTSIWSKLILIGWKNLTIRRRHWFLTICEIAIPIIFFILIAYARSKANVLGKAYENTTTYNEPTALQFDHSSTIYYAPNTRFVFDLMRKIQKEFSYNVESFKGYDSEADLLAAYATQPKDNLIAVVFKDVVPGEVPLNLRYEIRFTDLIAEWNSGSLYSSRSYYISGIGSQSYFAKGFIQLQKSIDVAYIELITNNTVPVNVVMQEFPYPPHQDDAGLQDMFLYVLPLVTIFSFVLLCPAVLQRIVEEKQTGIKELMKMMGLESWMLWTGWFFHAFFVNFLSVGLIVFFMKVKLWDAPYPPLEYCDWSLFTVFLLLYCSAGITFCFLISTMFNKPTIAMIVGIIVWILSYFIPWSLADTYPQMSKMAKLLTALFPNMALHYGYKAISVYETREIGANWSNLFQSASGGHNELTMGCVVVMLLIDSILFMVITVYIDAISPNIYKIAKPFYYPFKNFWDVIVCATKRKIKNFSPESENLKFEKNIEAPPNLPIGIEITNLFKSYKNTEAVADLSLDIYQGQITALLGHNGAGKTTTMGIITGMISASRGNIKINNYDINTDLSKIRNSLGLCPQHNLYFTDLTVLEHLIFFARLKGLSQAQARKDAMYLLDKLNLCDKKNQFPNDLSGGMKRKLCFCVALIGNPKVLILDEPTSGMDTQARRQMWDVLLLYRSSRTVLITTHSMEEADALGDRIAIMDHGNLVCYGTPMFLKEKYGTGHHLSIIRNEAEHNSEHDLTKFENQVNYITGTIEQVIPEAVLKSNNGNNLVYLLPNKDKPLFTKLLKKLEDNKQELYISHISMSMTTLEEVFLRAGNAATTETDENGCEIIIKKMVVKCVTGMDLVKSRLCGLVLKKLYVKRKNWKLEIAQVLTPILMTILVFWLGQSASGAEHAQGPRYELDLGIYGETAVIFGGSYKTDSVLSSIEQTYRHVSDSQKAIVIRSNYVSNEIIAKGIENIAYYDHYMIVAAEFNNTFGDSVIAFYSNKAMHGAPISLNLVMNAILKSLAGNQYSISTINAPLNTVFATSPQALDKIETAILWLMLFPIGIIFYIGTFIVFPQMENLTNIKQLQLMCGIKSYVYWCVCFMVDIVVYIIVIVIIMVIAAAFSTSTFMSGQETFAALFIILLVYGFSSIPYAYLFSYNKSASGGFTSFLISSLFVGVVFAVVILILENSGEEYYENCGKHVKYVGYFIPQIALCYSTVIFSQKAVDNYNLWMLSEGDRRRHQFCVNLASSDCLEYQSFFGGTNKPINWLLGITAGSTFIYLLLLLFFDSYWQKICTDFYHSKICRYKKLQFSTDPEDTNTVPNTDTPDCVDGASNRTSSSFDDERFHAENLKKVYNGKGVVRNVSFQVKPGECFGLLGVNGAGKTTTFRMLVCDEAVTNGTAKVNEKTGSLDMRNRQEFYLQKLGYCPQFNAINEVLTGKTMLKLFACIRGISAKSIDHHVDYWIDALGLSDYGDIPCGEYSGGNKRKLSVGIAMIGCPPVVMLDEPTSGVDPVSRQQLWNILTKLKSKKEDHEPQSIVLTSHNMYECEALCNNVAIMKDGKVQCQGTIPYLKEIYSKGFTVVLKLKCKIEAKVNNLQEVAVKKKGKNTESDSLLMNDSPDVDKVKMDFFEKYGHTCELKDEHSGMLHYQINHPRKRWSEIFDEIEKFKMTHDGVIEDYNISETTLEDVFLTVANLKPIA